jgi:O-antigen/teichoic acid export membrane protein
MLNFLTTRSKDVLSPALKSGAIWFFLANSLPSLVAVVLGPFALRKVGLEEYAVISLAGYFFNLVAGYSDFATYTHLLAIYSKKNQDRHIDLGNAFALKAGFAFLYFCTLIFFRHYHPRKDDLYIILAIFMIGIVLPSANIEWYFIARKRYLQFFLARACVIGSQIILTLVWFFSVWNSPRFIPAIIVTSGAVGSACLLWFLGGHHILKGLGMLRSVSFHGLRSLVFRLFPMAATLLITPYFLAYALPWYSLVSSDKKHLGAFVISYRLILGMSSLVAPLVFYSIPQGAASNRSPILSKAVGLSFLAGIGFWTLGIPVMWFYFHVSKVEPSLFFYSIHAFSVLLIGIFFLCLRTPYVGQWVAQGRYRGYFFIHLISCAPVLALSWIGGKRISPEAVLWLACLPDFLATTSFVGYDRLRPYLRRFRTVLAGA